MKTMIIIFMLLLNSTTAVCQGKYVAPYILKTDVKYMPGDTFKADIYLPLQYKKQQNPLLVFIDGYGGDFRKDDHYTSWAKFATAQGFICIVYSSRPGYLRSAFNGLLNFVFAKTGEYFADTNRLAVYAASGHVPQGLQLANGDRRVRAALMFYGPAKIDTFRLDMPVLLVRAGLDNVELNKQLDSLAFSALAADAPYTIANFNTELHAFEDFEGNSIASQLLGPLIDLLKNNMSAKARDNFLRREQEIIGSREIYNGRWLQAFNAYGLVLKNNPGNDEAERQLGNICIELKEYEKALCYYDSAIVHGNWRKGEIARKKLFAYARLDNVSGAVEEIRFLKKMGFFREADYAGQDTYNKVLISAAYKELMGKN